MHLDVVKAVSVRRLARLRHFMEANGLSALLLFEGDFVAVKLSLTQHFNVVVVTLDNVYVLVDAALYGETIRESPWEVMLVENFSLENLVESVASLLPGGSPGVKVGVNKMWGRGKLTYLYMDLLEALRSRSIKVVDATPLLAEVFDKPYEEELMILKWVSEVASRAIEAAYEHLRPGIRKYELAAVIDRVLDENGIVDRWFSTIVASGPRAAHRMPKLPPAGLATGNRLLLTLRPVWMGYDGCVAHTFVAGRSRYWEEVLEAVLQALSSGLEHVKPRTPIRVLDEVPAKSLRGEGCRTTRI